LKSNEVIVSGELWFLFTSFFLFLLLFIIILESILI